MLRSHPLWTLAGLLTLTAGATAQDKQDKPQKTTEERLAGYHNDNVAISIWIPRLAAGSSTLR